MESTESAARDSKSLHVRDRMRHPADVLLHPDHSMREALLRMRDKNLAFAPVVDGDALVGVLAVSRLPRRPRKEPHDRARLAVRDRMDTVVPFLYESDPLTLGSTIASHTGIAHFCVIDRDMRLTGTISFESDAAAATPESRKTITEATVRRRLAVTPARATASPPGIPRNYASGPVLYLRDVVQPDGAKAQS